MTKVDLITGFLGAGKTTFIRHYLRYCKEQNQKVLLIENEFGSVNIDTRWLRSETDEICDLSGVCMCCAGWLQLQRLLSNPSVTGYDRVIIEPSGIYDVDEFLELMGTEAVTQTCEIGCIITIVDPEMSGLTKETEDLLVSQIAAAGKILLSKAQLMPERTLSEASRKLEDLAERCCVSPSPLEKIYVRDWSALCASDFAALQSSAWRDSEHRKLGIRHSEVFSAVEIIGWCSEYESLSEAIQTAFERAEYGTVLRIKGSICGDDGCYEVNCTSVTRNIIPARKVKGILTVIGQHINAGAIRALFQSEV